MIGKAIVPLEAGFWPGPLCSFALFPIGKPPIRRTLRDEPIIWRL